MSELSFSLVSLAAVVGCMLLGMVLRRVLPEHHLGEDSRDVIKLGTGMIATLAALVLGLLIASAKANYDNLSNGLTQTAAKIVVLDRTLAQYGPELQEARERLRRDVVAVIRRNWPTEPVEGPRDAPGQGRPGAEAIQQMLMGLVPRDETHSLLRSRAMQVNDEIAESAWLLAEQKGATSLPKPLILVLVWWLAIIFFVFGLLSPRRATPVVVLLVCALSSAGALYLILELDRPYQGLVEISSAALRTSLAYLGH